VTLPPHSFDETSATTAGQPIVTVSWQVGPDGQLTHLPPLSGFKLIRLLSRIHRDDRHQLFELLSRPESASRHVLDLRCTRPQFGKGWVRPTVSANVEGDGYRFQGIAVDITDIKETERRMQERQFALNASLVELQRTKGRLETQSGILINTALELEAARKVAESASLVKSEFLSNMSHELRTPLNAIIGFSQIIREQTFGPVGSLKYCDYANDIYVSGIHLLELINKVLDFSKIEAGAAELLEDDVDVAAVIGTAIRMLRDRAAKKEIEITVEATAPLPLLRADPMKLRQILINLLTNAIKYTLNGGTVEISAWARPDSGYVLQVSDTGIGIALEDIPKAMGVFGQVDSALTREQEGTGLGLPLTKSLAELHGGSLELQSNLGVGTKVTVRFPAERIIENPDTIPARSSPRIAEIE
jgi:signal transduction histidine kinase